MAERTPDRPKREWRDIKRQAGCLWGCLTEPLVLFVLAIGSLLGAYSYGRKAERARLKQEQQEREENHE